MDELWNTLHDGDLIGIQGNVPGDLVLKIEIRFITKLMTSGEEDLLVSLADCDYFVYCPYDSASPVLTNLSEIANAQLWILGTYTDSELQKYGIHRSPEDGDALFISCTSKLKSSLNGVLKIRYRNFHLHLTDNSPISLAYLIEKAIEEW